MYLNLKMLQNNLCTQNFPPQKKHLNRKLQHPGTQRRWRSW